MIDIVVHASSPGSGRTETRRSNYATRVMRILIDAKAKQRWPITTGYCKKRQRHGHFYTSVLASHTPPWPVFWRIVLMALRTPYGNRR